MKRAAPFKYIKKIKNLELPAGSSIDFTCDMLLFSFYTRGMSFVDMAHLKEKSPKSGVLIYHRRKAKQQLTTKWEKSTQEIVDKYPDTNMYLLSIIREVENERKQYESALHLINNKLKEISIMINLAARLTMYITRHSWASVAKSKSISVSVISGGMEHDSESTTQIYLASLDNSVVDKANKLILKNL